MISTQDKFAGFDVQDIVFSFLSATNKLDHLVANFSYNLEIALYEQYSSNIQDENE